MWIYNNIIETITGKRINEIGMKKSKKKISEMFT